MLEKHCAISLQGRVFYSGYCRSCYQMWQQSMCPPASQATKYMVTYSILLSVVSISTALFSGYPDGENAFGGSNKTKYFRLRLCYEVS